MSSSKGGSCETTVVTSTWMTPSATETLEDSEVDEGKEVVVAASLEETESLTFLVVAESLASMVLCSAANDVSGIHDCVVG